MAPGAVRSGAREAGSRRGAIGGGTRGPGPRGHGRQAPGSAVCDAGDTVARCRVGATRDASPGARFRDPGPARPLTRTSSAATASVQRSLSTRNQPSRAARRPGSLSAPAGGTRAAPPPRRAGEGRGLQAPDPAWPSQCF
ncbi:putative uncharacterized protein encoded by MAPKAPK5-AS1 [Alexandromys fortis]|uniref:putative uncharacterized protein encoded by MAPKAPK5-AS1 n=1 Tax=Alexandromys fortis TaxID=100897 RepID=UPI00215398A1|nr:putative uncharacterized protein encoded by MAPKAPK5-AS1 [Microtus fortis]